MKQFVKILSLLFIFVLCCSFLGCVDLDELRKMRASVTAEGNIRLDDGTEYKQLPVCEELTPSFYDSEIIYVVEEDVPLLLMDALGDYFWKSDDGKFLESYDEENGYYCRTDVYDSMLRRIQAGFTPETYGYQYYDQEGYTPKFYILTKAQADAVSRVYNTQTPELLPEAAYLNYTYKADLYLCTQDGLFMRDTIDVCEYNEKYYVVSYTPESVALYRVPDDLYNVFSKILEKEIVN